VNIQVQTFAGSHAKRPQPVQSFYEDSQLLLLMNVWGNSALSSSLTQNFLQSFNSSKASTGYPRMLQAAQSLNQQLLKTENSQTWRSVIELAAIQKVGSRLHWLVAGEFEIFLQKDSLKFPVATLGPGVLPTLRQVPIPLLGMGLEPQFEGAQGEAAITSGTLVNVINGLQATEELESPFWRATIDFYR
jgi:hypothetical protein